MTRLRFAPDAEDFLDRVVRPGRGWVPDLFKALAFSPDLTAAWCSLADEVREHGLEPRRRELVILLVARLTGSEYEWVHHQQAGRAVGVTPAEVDDLEAWPASGNWSAEDRAVLTVAASVAGHEESPAWAVDQVRDVCGDKGFVDVCVTAAYYAGVARLVTALGVRLEDGDRSTDSGAG